MSKSKGEFLTVSLLKEKGYDPMVYRFFCLQSHYRKSLVFSWENMDNARVAYDKLISRIALLNTDGEIDQDAFDAVKAGFVKALDNDLNTSLAVTALYDVLKAKTNDATKRALLADFDTVLCLNLLENAEKVKNAKTEESPASDDPFIREIEELIVARREAKKAKDFAEADRIRAYLAEKGVTLIDSREGTTYKIEGEA
jgi:cysteinyl-tRNA synthetase